jgi:hypothetical protein
LIHGCNTDAADGRQNKSIQFESYAISIIGVQSAFHLWLDSFFGFIRGAGWDVGMDQALGSPRVV